MKRSQINQAIDDALALLEQHDFHLPKWALWTKQQWRQAGAEADEIRRCQLGWDVTDFASGDFSAVGLTLFTIRNGLPGQQSQGGKDYCEKLMFVGPGQVTPCHFHWAKMEDIINRAGGVHTMLGSIRRGRPDLLATGCLTVTGYTLGENINENDARSSLVSEEALAMYLYGSKPTGKSVPTVRAELCCTTGGSLG